MLKIEHLTKMYGDKKAVDDLTLHIQPGEIWIVDVPVKETHVWRWAERLLPCFDIYSIQVQIFLKIYKKNPSGVLDVMIHLIS